MKRILLFLLFPVLLAAAPSFKRVPSEIEPIVNKVLLIPEVQALLEEINEEGRITIVARRESCEGFNAMWDGGSRRILLGNIKSRGEASIARSLLMEMHNASTSRKLLRLGHLAQARKITKRQYVEGVERIEHQNLLKTLAILRRARHLFPSQPEWFCPKQFDDYFRVQISAGHSGWIADNYDRMV